MNLSVPQLVMIVHRGREPAPRLTDPADILAWVRRVREENPVG